ncbi:MAG: hypothetical protein RQ723_04225 [Desulfuromonadales bacterium]|nr:hypothetical protein [Desulfuromonadales bacterium]
MMPQTPDRLPLALLLLRLGIFVVMFIWTIDKFVRPEHAAAVFENFYFIDNLGRVPSYLIGTVELALLAGFLVGWKKRFTYGFVLVLHAVSTLSSFRQYLAPFEGPNILFFAAWPMLAACIALYLLRNRDTLWALGQS